MTILTATIEVETGDGQTKTRSISEKINSPLLELLLTETGEKTAGEDVDLVRARVQELREIKERHRDDVRSYRKAKSKQERAPFRDGFNAYRKAHNELRELGVPS